jgi:hypothetical protein
MQRKMLSVHIFYIVTVKGFRSLSWLVMLPRPGAEYQRLLRDSIQFAGSRKL